MNNTKIQTLEHRWPEGAIVYHIYPRSLQDSNGDGIGDLQGVISRLDYIKSLGVNAIWLSPFYPSPMADFGYDVADYCGVDPMFGTLDDFKELLLQAAKRDIKVMIDLVPNHSSDEHEWFVESAKSRDNEYADWYIWRDPKFEEGSTTPLPPNNWLDIFSGKSAWQWVGARQQYYLHSFHVRQPDLNWANPAVRDAMKDIMRFWLDMGVDGFRVDAVYFIGKEPLLEDNPPNPNYSPEHMPHYESLLHLNSQGWPFVYTYLHELAEVLKEEKYEDKHRFMVTEAYPARHNAVVSYLEFYAGMDPKVAAPFNFEGITLPWEAGAWRNFLRSFHTALDQFSPYSVASYAFGNHDQARLLNRLGGHTAAARGAAVLLLTLPGMSFIYYGEEIGMRNVDIPPEFIQDPAAIDDPGHNNGRDPERTPMQWSADTYGGFTDGDGPWLPLAADFRENNVAAQEKDPTSFLSLYRTLGKLRNESASMKKGSIEVIESGAPEVLGYIRRDESDDAYLVLINFAAFAAVCQPGVQREKFILSSDPKTQLANQSKHKITLQPYEAAIFSLAL